MTACEIRLMKEEDVPQVAAIEREAISPPWSEQSCLESLVLPHTLFLVAETEGEISGYCCCYRSLEEGEITNVAVRRKLRGRGIGEALLRELFRIGASEGIEAYTLEVRVSNETAIRLYGKLGFESAGIRKNFYEKPREDACIMWKR